MSTKANPAIIGGFVILAIIIAVAGIVGLGSGRFFKESTQYIVYFDGDLSGLDVGAPVTYRGVHLGQVNNVSLVYDHETEKISTPVIIEILQDSFIEVHLDQADLEINQIERHCQMGMRARLESVSIVTGKLKVDLDHYPKTKAVYKAKDHPLQEIPAIPRALDTLSSRLSQLPFDEIILDLQKSINGIARVVNSDELSTGMSELNVAIHHISELVGSDEASGSVAALQDSLVEVRELMQEFRIGVRPIRRDVSLAIEEFSGMVRAAKDFLDYIDRHPEAILRGKEPDQ
jgi:paraquat-inducible protein B